MHICWPLNITLLLYYIQYQLFLLITYEMFSKHYVLLATYRNVCLNMYYYCNILIVRIVVCIIYYSFTCLDTATVEDPALSGSLMLGAHQVTLLYLVALLVQAPPLVLTVRMLLSLVLKVCAPKVSSDLKQLALYLTHFIGSTTTTGTGSSVYIGGSVGGVIFLCCCCCICIAIFGSQGSKSNSSSSHVVSPPRTVVVARDTPRAVPSAQNFAFFAVKEEVVVIRAQELARPEAKTHAGEAPPDYYSAQNYPKAN